MGFAGGFLAGVFGAGLRFGVAAGGVWGSWGVRLRVGAGARLGAALRTGGLARGVGFSADGTTADGDLGRAAAGGGAAGWTGSGLANDLGRRSGDSAVLSSGSAGLVGFRLYGGFEAAGTGLTRAAGVHACGRSLCRIGSGGFGARAPAISRL